VFVAVLTVSVTVTGLADVGFTVLEGEKLQVAFAGSPLQLNVTVCPNEPAAVTWKVAVAVRPCATGTGFGLTAPTAKSTTCNVAAASCVIAFASVPTAWALKL
jgi:hypothetical protein